MANLRTPKGTIDLNPIQSYAQTEVLEKILTIFKAHNGVPINTPMYELREILLNKYGEEAKLIYNLEDQGGDICSLRYDLTVPFARYLATNRISKIRRYQVGNVFRRDNPSFKTGRLREFTQADFDICGDNIPMVNDSEILKMIYDILTSLGTTQEKSKFIIKINDRRIILGFLQIASIPENFHSTICSTIDKVEKLSKEELFNEFKSKGLDNEQIDKVCEFIFYKGTNDEILSFLSQTVNNVKEKLMDERNSSPVDNIINGFQQAIEEFYSLFKYLTIYKIEEVKIDLSLARGLDYYTGLIIEASYIDHEIGSVIGGGRYHNLCRSISNFSVPCVGFSVGISRICSICKPKELENEVFVGSGYGLMLEDRIEMLGILWSNNIKAEIFTGKRVNFKDQLEYAKKNNFKYMVLTGQNEYQESIYTIFNLSSGVKENIPRQTLINYFLGKL